MKQDLLEALNDLENFKRYVEHDLRLDHPKGGAMFNYEDHEICLLKIEAIRLKIQKALEDQ